MCAVSYLNTAPLVWGMLHGDQQGAFVLVVDASSKVELRRVDVTRNTRGQAVIGKGLKEGENVITEGAGKVRPGITVDAATAAGG